MHKNLEFIWIIIQKFTRALKVRPQQKCSLFKPSNLYSTIVSIRRDESRKVEITDIEVKKSFRNSTVQWRISPNALSTPCT